MNARTRPSAVAVVCVLLFGKSARAQEPNSREPARTGAHCQGEGRPKVLLNETLLVQVNPLGGEHQVAFSVCTPLIKKPGILFERTRVETGVMHYLGPIWSFQGGFLNISPLSILNLHAEASTGYLWPIPMAGAGYYSLESYRADLGAKALPAGKGTDAVGVNALFSATLQFKVGVAPGLSVGFVETPGVIFWYMGKGPYYSHPRDDVTLARLDWVVRNSALALMEYSPHDVVTFRLGAVDELKYVPHSGYVGHLAGFLVSTVFKPVGPGLEIQPFIRATQYIMHRKAEGVLMVGGLNVFYALAR